MPKKALSTTLLTLEKYIFVAHVFIIFCCFSSLSIMSIFRSVFKEFVFAFTIPFTFREIMKTLVLVEHLSTTSF